MPVKICELKLDRNRNTYEMEISNNEGDFRKYKYTKDSPVLTIKLEKDSVEVACLTFKVGRGKEICFNKI